MDAEPDLTEDGEKSIAPNLRGNHDRNVTRRFAQDAKGAQEILEKEFFFLFFCPQKLGSFSSLENRVILERKLGE